MPQPFPNESLMESVILRVLYFPMNEKTHSHLIRFLSGIRQYKHHHIIGYKMMIDAAIKYLSHKSKFLMRNKYLCV